MGHIVLATPWLTSGTPPHPLLPGHAAGCLASQPRPGTVFCQYIVSYVDEDARQKALKRLEDEISVSEREQASVINSRLPRSKPAVIKPWPNSSRKRTELERKYDEQTATALEPIIQEGQRLELFFQDNKGKVLTEGGCLLAAPAP